MKPEKDAKKLPVKLEMLVFNPTKWPLKSLSTAVTTRTMEL